MPLPAMTRVSTRDAPAAIGPYSQAVVVADWVYASGQIGLDPETGQLVDTSIRDETRRVLQNLGAVLTAAGADLSAVVKTTVFLVDLQDFAAINDVYGDVFGEAPPARSTVQVAALPRGARVEIEAIARLQTA